MTENERTYRVVADGPLADAVTSRLPENLEILPWSVALEGAEDASSIDAIYTYGHPTVDGPMMDRFPSLRVISNYGVGVDHIDLAAANERELPVGNTPGILDGATADMAFTLLLATGRRLIEGDRYARSDQFTSYDPGYMLGQEIHGTTMGIIGLGRIGWQIAQRARGFSMKLLYHNRSPRLNADTELDAEYANLDRLLEESDYVVLSTPLTDETRGLIGYSELSKMKSTACLINIGRGPLVDTQALTQALKERMIYAAGLDVTDPEPLPRDHPLLQLDNVTIAPHLGSATWATRDQMAANSVENLLLGLNGEPLAHQVNV